MNYLVKSEKLEKFHSTCLVLPVFEQQPLSLFGEELDIYYNGCLSTFLKNGDMTGKLQQTAIFYPGQAMRCERVVLVGLGKAGEISSQNFRKWVQCAWQTVAKLNCKHAHWNLFDWTVSDRDSPWQARTCVEIIENARYRYSATKSKVEPDTTVCRKITFVGTSLDNVAAVKAALSQGEAISAGVALCRSLGDLPGNICTPSYLADQAKALCKGENTLSAEILGESQMEKLGMGALLSVSKGSREPAKLIIMKYQGDKADNAPIVLVGKGLTFDAGGISIKPSQAMDEMKYDMCGGATVFGVIKACHAMQLPLNVIGVVPSSENLPDGAANKPGDIVTSMSGQTIEILNTDAEGRLLLCDALTYSKRFKPKLVIDIATLTGACVVALGDQVCGLMSNNQALAEQLLIAGEKAEDRCWQLPLLEGYQEQLKSNFADMANIGGKGAGAITAACFLSRYTEDFTWAHLDIAGTAWNSGSPKGATGRPVALLCQFLLDQCDS